MSDKKERNRTQEKLKSDQKVKKCPFCSSYMALEATQCPSCKHKVGAVDHLGRAKKPVDWKAYLSAVAAIAIFIGFVWWATNR